MEWLLAISVILNILFALLIAALTYGLVVSQSEAQHNHDEWSRWESIFYEVQGRLIDERNLFVSPKQGAYGKMLIKEHVKKSD